MMTSPRFASVGETSAKVCCTICRRTGWGVAGDPDLSSMPRSHWQRKCAGPHDHACTCGRAFVGASALEAHVNPRRHRRDAAYIAAHQPVVKRAA